MRNFWAKLILLAIVALAFTLPAWAIELKLSGSYEIQGRYYNQSDILHAKTYTANAAIGSQAIPAATYGAAYIAAYAAYTTGLGYSPAQAAALAKTAATAAQLNDPYVPGGDVTDTIDNDAYLKHYFCIDPTLLITDRISIKANIIAFENKLSEDEYGRTDTEPRDYDHYDRYNIFRIDNLWAEVLTDYGQFIVGKTAGFLGIGYFIRIPDLEGWTFGLIWDKGDEDGDDENNGIVKKTTGAALDSDTADEDAVVLVANYNTDNLSFAGKLAYGWSGSDNSTSSSWVPIADVTYKMDALTISAYARYQFGTFVDKGSNKGMVDAAEFAPLLTALEGTYTAIGRPLPGTFLVANKFKDDFEFDGLSAYVELSYDASEQAGFGLMPKLTLAYASGADEPQIVSGCFDDDMDFGSWLMNDVSDKYAMYFETPASNINDGIGNPDMDDYSFSNIMLVRLGADAEVTDKLSVTGNIIWAQKANTDYLEKYNPELGTLNALNADLTKISTIGQYDPAFDGNLGLGHLPTTTSKINNNVDEGLGWEINAKATYQVQDNFSVALQAAYYVPGDFYESAFEKTFGNTLTGLELENEYAARWFATVTF